MNKKEAMIFKIKQVTLFVLLTFGISLFLKAQQIKKDPVDFRENMRHPF